MLLLRQAADTSGARADEIDPASVRTCKVMRSFVLCRQINIRNRCCVDDLTADLAAAAGGRPRQSRSSFLCRWQEPNHWKY